MFSKSCEYGIRAMLYLSSQSVEGRRVKVGEIAKNSGCPVAFTAKLLNILNKAGLVLSQTGPNGGFYLDPTTFSDLRLSQIVSAIDGDTVYKGCGLGLDACDELNPCPLHHSFVKIRSDLKEMLETTLLIELAKKLKKGETVLIR